MTTLAEQVAELKVERDALRVERDEWREHFNTMSRVAIVNEQRCASAKVEGARACQDAFCDGAAWELGAIRKRTARQEAESRYPAPASGEGVPLARESYWCGCVRDSRWERCERHTELDLDEEPPTQAEDAAKRTPPSAPERIELVLEVELAWSGPDEIWERKRVRISPADARRIVGMAQGGTE